MKYFAQNSAQFWACTIMCRWVFCWQYLLRKKRTINWLVVKSDFFGEDILIGRNFIPVETFSVVNFGIFHFKTLSIYYVFPGWLKSNLCGEGAWPYWIFFLNRNVYGENAILDHIGEFFWIEMFTLEILFLLKLTLWENFS